MLDTEFEEGPDRRGLGKIQPKVGIALFVLVLVALVAFSLTGASVEDVETRSNGGPEDNSYMDLAAYNGSTECGTCHLEAHTAWKDSLHPAKMKVASDSTVVGDWDTDPMITVGDGVDVTVLLERDGSDFTVDLDSGGTHVYVVDYVLGGGGWMQQYLTTIGNSLYILPIQWNVETSEWVGSETEDWYDNVGAPEEPAMDRSWDLRCAGCHVTGFDVEYNDTSGEWTASWEELGVGCEACHGPGSLHINPPDGGTREEYIWSTVDSAICGACHNRGRSVGTLGGREAGYPLDPSANTYFPGDDMTSFFVPDGIYHPDDNTSRVHRQQYPDYIGHPHADSLTTILESERGQETCLKCHSTDYMLAVDDDKPAIDAVEFSIECVACHGPHGTANDYDLRVDRDEVCSQCHRTFDTPPGETVHHPQTEMVAGQIQIPEIDGTPWMGGEAVCADCHMPYVATSAVDYDIASHSFYHITPAKSISLGMPNSCTVTCHGGDEGAGGILTDVQALDYIESARANITGLLPDAETSVAAAKQALDDAEGYGFTEDTILLNTELYNKTLLSKEYIVSDGTMVHNPDFSMDLLNYAVTEGGNVVSALTPGSIKGVVQDADGKTIEGATIQQGGKTWATTAADGSFEVLIAPGTYKFQVHEGDRMTLEFDAESPAEGNSNDLGDLKYDSDGNGGNGDTLIWLIVIALVVVVIFAVLLMVRGRDKTGEDRTGDGSKV
jgi:predicted CXXCH cytochrome family protein